MTFDQQLTERIAETRREILAQLDDRLKTLAADLGQVASAEFEARTQSAATAVAAAQADAEHRVQEALAAAQTDAERRAQDTAAAAQADASRQVEEAVAACRLELDQRAAQSAVAAKAETDARLVAAVAAARQEVEDAARQTSDRAVVESRAASLQSEFEQLERVIQAVRRFDQARSLTDVLDTLGDVASREAPRVALFLVRGTRLAGWRATGFGPSVDARAIEVSSDEASLLWRSIASGQPLATTDLTPGHRVTTPFGALGPDAAGLAVPIRVGGETVAVVYADDASDGVREVPSPWPEVIELLARHAARCLEVLTLSKAVQPIATTPPRTTAPRATPPARSAPTTRADDDESARRYARLLVSEIKLYHEAAVTEGRTGHNLSDRLRSEIDRARKLYEERVPSEIRSRSDHFHQELVRTLANGDPALLGASGA